MSSIASAVTRTMAAWILVIAGITPAISQAPRNVDLQLSGTLSPAGQMRPGTTALLTLTFRNNGPDDSPSVGAVSTPYIFGQGEQFALVAAAPSPCSMQFTDFNAPPGSGRPSVLIAIVRAGPLAAGASTTCTVAVPIAPAASGAAALSFDVRDGAVVINDPNPSNNVVSFGLVFDPPVAVPALNGALLMLLALATAIAAGIHPRLRQ